MVKASPKTLYTRIIETYEINTSLATMDNYL